MQKLDEHAEEQDDTRLLLVIASSVRRYGHELRLRLDAPDVPNRDPKLVQLLVRAWRARDLLIGPDAKSLEPQMRRELNRPARPAYFAPDIIIAILDGRNPASLSARKLERMGKVPMDWTSQRRALGFATA